MSRKRSSFKINFSTSRRRNLTCSIRLKFCQGKILQFTLLSLAVRESMREPHRAGGTAFTAEIIVLAREVLKRITLVNLRVKIGAGSLQVR